MPSMRVTRSTRTFRPPFLLNRPPRCRVVSVRRPRLILQRATEEEILLVTEVLKIDAEDRMNQAVEVLTQKLSTIRTGRANPAVLDRITVDYYGAQTPLKSLAAISVPNSSTLLISPFDMQALADIEKAIQTSDLGLTPSNDGEKIRIAIPQLTDERRKELVKTVSKICEEGRVAVRNVRRDVVKSSAKVGMSEDAVQGFKDTLQKGTDETIAAIDKILKEKEKELTTL